MAIVRDDTAQNTAQAIEGIDQLSRLLKGSLPIGDIQEMIALLGA